MLSGSSIISIFCLYMGLLFVLALWARRRSMAGRSLVDNPFVYSFSLAVYCSSWTFYGSVGQAANSGLLFLTVYLGPTLVAVFGGGLWRKMIRLKNTYRITSIADFISTRYEKSETLAALVTLICLVGTIPYVALQLKAVLASFAVLTAHEGSGSSWVASHVSAVVVGLMILFTIIFGVRSLEPTERHEGIVMAVAVESLVKLISLLAVGIFVVYGVFDGFSDIFSQAALNPVTQPLYHGQSLPVSLITWVTYIVISANAILCLPRQFHITVVENRREDHVRWSMWLFPLYLFAINIFIYPVAVGGLLKGFPLAQADTFVLQFPLFQDSHIMALVAFIGGFSAATSMILICSMTMATMISNHLLLPLVDWIPQLNIIERRLLQCRWLAVAGFIILGYLFERQVALRLRLADIGMLSFAAVLQLAPALIGGLFWRGGNQKGVYWGLLTGFAVWIYTLLLPVFAGTEWIPDSFIEQGPLGLTLLCPRSLFGLTGLDPVVHSAFWSLAFNITFYIMGSLLDEPSQENRSQAEAFVGSPPETYIFPASAGRRLDIPLKEKHLIIQELFSRYFESDRAEAMADQVVAKVGLSGRELASITELAELYDQVEKTLGGSIGSATANRALVRAGFFSHPESEELRKMYAEILVDLSARPADLKRKIDFYKEREALIEKHAAELEEKVSQLEGQITLRRRAEKRLRESEERYRLAIEGSSDGVAVIHDLKIIWGNQRLAEIFGYEHRREVLTRHLSAIVHPDDRERALRYCGDRQDGKPAPSRYDFKGLKKDGTLIYIAVSATTVGYHGRTLVLTYLRDVTRRRLAEEQIHHLSQRLIVGIEEERRRLAADLHDEFGQALTGLHMGVESLLNSLPREHMKIQVRGYKLITVIEHLAESLRNICSELRPDMLDHLGLVATVEWYVNEFRERVPGLHVDLRSAGFGGRRLDPNVEIALYRILQEGLNNVVKHAEATSVAIQLTYSHPQVIMVISDNGKGFHSAESAQPDGFGKGGIGLISMKERVASVGGSMDIHGNEGKGTMIRISLPAIPVKEDHFDGLNLEQLSLKGDGHGKN